MMRDLLARLGERLVGHCPLQRKIVAEQVGLCSFLG
jgi:hypothetical protein